MSNEAVLYCAHAFNPMIEGEIERLRAELHALAHWVVGYANDDRPLPAPDRPERVLYRRSVLSLLPYPNKIARVNWANSMGNNDLPPLAFYREHPGYDFYWLIEYDVRYTGSWRELFGELRGSDADLLCTTVQDAEEIPRWRWWSTLVDLPHRPLQLLRAFLPFCRVSNRAMAAIDRWYSEGGAGHPELVWPSVCRTAGLKVEDVGGTGRYTPVERRGRHYSNTPLKSSLSPGTFVFRPPFKHALIQAHGFAYAGRPMLWHPIKS